jgi:hypothetical protein
MWKTALLGASLAAIGWALSGGQRQTIRRRNAQIVSGLRAGPTTEAQLPANVSSLQAYKRRHGDSTEALRSARLAVDGRLNDLLGRQRDAA